MKIKATANRMRGPSLRYHAAAAAMYSTATVLPVLSFGVNRTTNTQKRHPQQKAAFFTHYITLWRLDQIRSCDKSCRSVFQLLVTLPLIRRVRVRGGDEPYLVVKRQDPTAEQEVR